jgi:Peptidase M15
MRLGRGVQLATTIDRTRVAAFAAIILAGAGVAAFYQPTPAPTAPFAAIAGEGDPVNAGPSLNAFGASHEVRVRVTLPEQRVEFPVQVGGDIESLSYEWIRERDSVGEDLPQPLTGAGFVAPRRPGFYHLAIERGATRQILPQPTLVVLVPFSRKVGGTLNGYRIGTYVAERITQHDRPDGFVEVNEADLDLKVSDHLRLGDFVTHDQQDNVWPKYVALNPRLLDKLELVLAKLGARARMTAANTDGSNEEPADVAFDVHSGYRTPAHNRNVWRAATDSRHEYGDAADLAIDADGDGRITLRDELLVARAVDEVEAEHPELVGGLGLYTSGRYNTPYVHIDARGTRSRWRG